MENVAGILEVFLSKSAEQIIVKHKGPKSGANVRFPIKLSPRQARHLASALMMLAEEAEAETQKTKAYACARISNGPNASQLH